jgi:hypothetical protein
MQPSRDDLSFQKGEIEPTAAERSQPDLIRPETVEVKLATHLRAGSRTIKDVTRVEQQLEPVRL